MAPVPASKRNSVILFSVKNLFFSLYLDYPTASNFLKHKEQKLKVFVIYLFLSIILKTLTYMITFLVFPSSSLQNVFLSFRALDRMISSTSLTSLFNSALAFWNDNDVSSPTRLYMTCKKLRFLPVNPQSFAQFLCRLPTFSLFYFTYLSSKFLLFAFSNLLSCCLWQDDLPDMFVWIMFYYMFLYCGFLNFSNAFRTSLHMKRRKSTETQGTLESNMKLLKLWFFLKKASLVLLNITFRHFQRFRRIELAQSFCFHDLLGVIKFLFS